jgi:hypothetical protein
MHFQSYCTFVICDRPEEVITSQAPLEFDVPDMGVEDFRCRKLMAKDEATSS